MSALGGAAALLLAGVFCWAAGAKLRHPGGTRRSFAALGLPAPAALAALVPLTELSLAALLAARPRAGGAAALALLAAFSVVLWRRAARIRVVGCGCFGAASSDAAPSTALARNGLLAVAALLALASPSGARPDLPALVAAGALGVNGLVLVALWDLRARTGRLWDNRVEEGA